MTDLDAIADPVNPYTCERCEGKDRTVRLYENGDAGRLGEDWRLMPLHPGCFRRWQGEVDLGLSPAHGRDPVVDYGWWTLRDGRQARLTWRKADGQLYLLRPDDLGGRQNLLTLESREDADALLSGWAEAHGDMEWLGRRLSLAGATWTPPRLRTAT